MRLTRTASEHRNLRRIVSVALLVLVLAPACTRLKRFAYEGLGRDDWQQPDRVVGALSLEPGDRVADLGSGGGYFTFRLADAVGASGHVYAVDVDAAMNEYVREQARKRGYANVSVVLATPDDARLPESDIDLVFISNTYHHVEERIGYFTNLRRYLEPGARVAIVEFRKSGWWGRPHSTESEVIQSELEQAGYHLEQEHDFLSRQHFLVFSLGPPAP